jgi:hypothetical protein
VTEPDQPQCLAVNGAGERCVLPEHTNPDDEWMVCHVPDEHIVFAPGSSSARWRAQNMVHSTHAPLSEADETQKWAVHHEEGPRWLTPAEAAKLTR